MALVLHLPTLTLLAADADMVAPELRSAQPPLPTPFDPQTSPPIACPSTLDLRTADRARIRSGIGLTNAAIDIYRDRFRVARAAQGDLLRLEQWQDQVACSVVKQRMLEGHVSGDYLVCPQTAGATAADRLTELKRIAEQVPHRHWVREGLVLREADATEKAAADVLPQNVSDARARKLAEINEAAESRRSLRQDARLLLRKVDGDDSAEVNAAVDRQRAAELARDAKLAQLAAAASVPEIEAIAAAVDQAATPAVAEVSGRP